jgi:hypothetical protein
MKYDVITTLDALQAYIGESKEVAFSLHTLPEDTAWNARKAQIKGISIAVKEDSAVYLPLIDPSHPLDNEQEEIWDWLRFQFFTNDYITKISHNLAIPTHFLFSRNMMITEPVFDTMIAAEFITKLPGVQLSQVTPTDVPTGLSDEESMQYHQCHATQSIFAMYQFCKNILADQPKLNNNLCFSTSLFCGLLQHYGFAANCNSPYLLEDRLYPQWLPVSDDNGIFVPHSPGRDEIPPKSRIFSDESGYILLQVDFQNIREHMRRDICSMMPDLYFTERFLRPVLHFKNTLVFEADEDRLGEIMRLMYGWFDEDFEQLYFYGGRKLSIMIRIIPVLME